MGSTFVIDRSGNVRFESRSLMPRTENYSQQENFKFHRKNADNGLYISLPWTSQRSEYVIGISRRLNDVNENFDGVVIATLKLSYFYDLFKNVNIARGDNLSIFRTNGTGLMRMPFDMKFIGRDLSNVPLFSAIKKAPFGSYELKFPTDNVLRLAAYHQAGNNQFVVTAGRSIVGIYAGWRAKPGRSG